MLTKLIIKLRCWAGFHERGGAIQVIFNVRVLTCRHCRKAYASKRL
ncbi:MAG: hypothetical protein Q8Q08_13030 [Candidatus Omnitrophota bacterium]|nr:hypothetical protein [Candidatus Omnitrophota bacterium]